MKTIKLALLSAFAVCFLTLVSSVQAAGPIIDAGWMYDQIDAADTDSVESPYIYVLTDPSVFSITDAFNTGDTYSVYDFGLLILTTSVGTGVAFPPSEATADSAWEGGIHSIGSVSLSPGAHSLTIQGDGVGGVPAGLYTRIDTERKSDVPETGSTLILLGGALAGLVTVGRKAKK